VEKMKTSLVVTACMCLAGCSAAPTETDIGPTVIATATGPAATDTPRTLYEDDEMRVAAVSYGHWDSPEVPGLYIWGKASRKWIRIDKVSLRGAILGRSPTFAECRAAGVNPPSVGWDYRRLKGRGYVEMPLMTTGSLNHPDRIERDEEAGRLVLRFNSHWRTHGRMASAETVMVIALDDLRHLLTE
jgi:hypothetical protein